MILSFLRFMTQYSLVFSYKNIESSLNKSMFNNWNNFYKNENFPSTNILNLDLMNKKYANLYDNYVDFSSTMAFHNGQKLFDEINFVLEVLFPESMNSMKILIENASSSMFSNINTVIYDATKEYQEEKNKKTCEKIKMKKYLYQLFSDAKSLVSPFLYAEYKNAFDEGEFSMCYGLLNTQFGKMSLIETSLLKAIKQKKKLLETETLNRGVLFVDVTNEKTYFLNLKNKDCDSNILILPNFFLDHEKFCGLSLFAISKICENSIHSNFITKLFNEILKIPKNRKEGIPVVQNKLILLSKYKYLVYHTLSLEVLGIDKNTTEKWISELAFSFLSPDIRYYIPSVVLKKQFE